MARHTFIFETIYHIVDKFIIDWQNEPNRWYKEIDIQTELIIRFNTVLHLLDQGIVKANYDPYKGWENGNVFSRVTTQDSIKDTKTGFNIKPDIIILDDLSNTAAPPDRDYKVRQNWPIIWACEIKTWDVGDATKENVYDIEKLSNLKSGSNCKYACFLSFLWVQSEPNEDSVVWNKTEDNFWSCKIKVPSNKVTYPENKKI